MTNKTIKEALDEIKIAFDNFCIDAEAIINEAKQKNGGKEWQEQRKAARKQPRQIRQNMATTSTAKWGASADAMVTQADSQATQHSQEKQADAEDSSADEAQRRKKINRD